MSPVFAFQKLHPISLALLFEYGSKQQMQKDSSDGVNLSATATFEKNKNSVVMQTKSRATKKPDIERIHESFTNLRASTEITVIALIKVYLALAK
ncbi:unnamed protein product [Pieris brassicae]|uniref:Uncharacterized protein n=1 Tax=Pieris brassicae TaxID=7116 RepID=A0A9P0X8A3_PIEBR|nr:unnamed protein product [Pieris brassicae]